jgi:hypothetical protein
MILSTFVLFCISSYSKKTKKKKTKSRGEMMSKKKKGDQNDG